FKRSQQNQQETIVIHSWQSCCQQKPLVKIRSAQVVKIQSAPTPLETTDKAQAQQLHENWKSQSWSEKMNVDIGPSDLTLSQAFKRVWNEDGKLRNSKSPQTIEIKINNVVEYFDPTGWST
ncbi:hypothetical protein, partial [Rhodoferax lacus]|uniref:hypothetical protein n=1 Tax=Rhodoferax lacus TaxID=2184758 RepID=UPI0013146B4B